MPIYMKYEGIEGSVTGKYKGWIELESCQIGTYKEGGAGKISISEIVVTKLQDRTSPFLFREAISGTPKKVIIDFIQEGEGAPYLSIELEKALITSFNTIEDRGNSREKAIETFSINFDKATYSYKATAAAKDPKAAKTKAQWNLVAP